MLVMSWGDFLSIIWLYLAYLIYLYGTILDKSIAMKKYICIALLFAGCVASAQDTKTQPAGTATVQPASIPYPNAPEITFVKTEHDFGTLKKGQPATYKFEYKNTGKEDLVISTCKPGCECTTVKCAKDPVKPGKTGFVEVHYDSTRVGKFGKEILIHSNARKPVVFLIIRGNIELPEEAGKSDEKMQSPVEKKIE